MRRNYIGIRAVTVALATTLLSFLCVAEVCAQKLTGDGYSAKQEANDAVAFLYAQDATPYMTLSGVSAPITWSFSPDGATEPTILKVTQADADTLNVRTPGLYTAEASGQTFRAWWLSPAPNAISMAVDSADCDAIYVRAVAYAPDFSFGGNTLSQNIVYQWEVADSVVVTTRDTVAAIEGLYEEAALTVRAINQAFNDVATTDTVMPVGVSASFSYENRKVDAENEATSTDNTLSSPAEVVFSNKSKGSYTVSEWAIGSLARLYDDSPVYQFQQPGTYRVTLTVTNEASGCASSDSSVTITVSEAALEFPNAFTPNGDGVNDVFCPAFRSLKSYELTIYNRWGHRVFTSSDPSDGWDGKVNGRDAAAGTYYFIAKAEGFERGVEFYKKGSITLVR